MHWNVEVLRQIITIGWGGHMAMDEQFLEATERAIDQVVSDFQSEPNRFWNERDVHWSLFYYLKQQEIFQRHYATELIRAEFPTLGKYGKEGKEARGHFDLVILDPALVAADAVHKLPPWAPWDDYLPLVKVLVALEVKTWVDRLRFDRTKWDIQKLVDPVNQVEYRYFLNFVQLNWEKTEMKAYYQKLRRHLSTNIRPKLKILCISNDIAVQPRKADNWILPLV